MISEFCAEMRNYFTEDKDKHFGDFEISGGVIAPSDFLQEGQYFRIVGSVFNDGVYQYPCSTLTPEKFNGAVWAMKIPPEVLGLTKEIEEYKNRIGKEMAEAGWDVFQSQSFGGYSGTVKDDISWQKAFKTRLRKWRKI